MGKLNHWYLYTIALFSLSFFHLNSFAQDTIYLTNGEWPPYLSENMPDQGIVSQIVREAFALEDIKVVYGFFPWARSYYYSENGEWDGSVIWYRNAEREKSHYFSDPVITANAVFFHLKTQPFEWHTIEDIYGKRLSALSSEYFTEAFEIAENSHKFKMDRASSYKEAFRLLVGTRVDIVPATDAVGRYMIKQLFPPEVAATITHHPRALKEAPLYVLFSRNKSTSPYFVERFNQGLKKLKQSGRYQQLVAYKPQ